MKFCPLMVLSCVFLSGCLLDRSGASPMDAAVVDAHVPLTDGGPRDAGTDAGPFDAGPFDAGPFDAGPGPFDAGPCAAGPDSDADGVVDACDLCPGGDDRIDLDDDGVPFDCDAWPCGDVMPSVPAQPAAESIEIRQVTVAGGGLNHAVVTVGQRVPVSFEWTVDDLGCPGCIDQIEVGTAPGDRLGCVFDANPRPGGESGNASFEITPSVPGTVDLRFNLGQRFDCDDADTWWGEPPGEANTFARLCVVPSLP